jgi:hypothetical protein
MALTRYQAQYFYDRFGKKQDIQAFYEDAALDNLIAQAAPDDFGYHPVDSHSIFLSPKKKRKLLS